jgi:hypothetical protein
MQRREFLAAASAAAAAPASAADPARPNVLVLMPDQWRGQDLGSMGNEQVKTPALDRLAGEARSSQRGGQLSCVYAGASLPAYRPIRTR